MEVSRVLQLVQMTSDRCSFKDVEIGAAVTQLGKEVESMKLAGQQLDMVTKQLLENSNTAGGQEDGDVSAVVNTGPTMFVAPANSSADGWFSLQLGEAKFTNMEGVLMVWSLVVAATMASLFIPCLIRCCFRRRIKAVAQVN